jgi:hypothetical protein
MDPIRNQETLEKAKRAIYVPERIESIKRLIEMNEYSLALSYLNRAYTLAIDVPEIMECAEQYQQLGKTEKVVELVQRAEAITISSSHSEGITFRSRMSQWYASNGDIDQAKQMMKSAEDCEDVNGMTWVRIADGWYGLNEISETHRCMTLHQEQCLDVVEERLKSSSNLLNIDLDFKKIIECALGWHLLEFEKEATSCIHKVEQWLPEVFNNPHDSNGQQYHQMILQELYRYGSDTGDLRYQSFAAEALTSYAELVEFNGWEVLFDWSLQQGEHKCAVHAAEQLEKQARHEFSQYYGWSICLRCWLRLNNREGIQRALDQLSEFNARINAISTVFDVGNERLGNTMLLQATKKVKTLVQLSQCVDLYKINCADDLTEKVLDLLERKILSSRVTLCGPYDNFDDLYRSIPPLAYSFHQFGRYNIVKKLMQALESRKPTPSNHKNCMLAYCAYTWLLMNEDQQAIRIIKKLEMEPAASPQKIYHKAERKNLLFLYKILGKHEKQAIYEDGETSEVDKLYEGLPGFVVLTDKGGTCIEREEDEIDFYCIPVETWESFKRDLYRGDLLG